MPKRPGSSPSADSPQDDRDAEALWRFVAILQQARTDQKLTLRALAHGMQVIHSHLNKAEHRETQPGWVILHRWCRALGLGFEEVYRQAQGDPQS